ncbi:MAG: TMEM175 family protein [Xenococcaceae cyanobacterium MO_188.B32]|nr:TMEM175 family protein [Xenococcaceae cyanobacterium MO_188.B32]
MANENQIVTKEKEASAAHGNERLFAFSDGVFAITITLLVLEIKVPEIAEELVATELPQALLHLVPEFVSHIISFFVLGVFWVAHHNMFGHIKKHDHVLLWLNIIFLLCVASIPFPTGLLGKYPNEQITVAIYAGMWAITAVVLELLWWYATTHGMVDQDTDPDFITFVHRHIRKAPIFYLISIGVSFFSLTISKFIFIAVAIFYILPNPLERKHYKTLARRFNQ